MQEYVGAHLKSRLRWGLRLWLILRNRVFPQGLLAWIKTLWGQESDRWILWFPVALGTGVGVYFKLATEPPVAMTLTGLIGSCLSALLCWKHSLPLRRLTVGCVAVTLGLGAAQLHTCLQNPSQLGYPLSGVTLEGTITALEHLQPTEEGLAYRVILDNLHIRKAPTKWAYREARALSQVRLILKQVTFPLWVGQRLGVQATLLPFPQPYSPYGHDMAMQAFFKGWSATGFATQPPHFIESTPPTWTTRLANMRHRLTRLFLNHMPAPTGALASALITGDKASVPPDVLTVFAGSGIAHLLAISGLHLSIVAGLFYLFIHGIFGLIPALALRLPLHKIAAGFSLGGTGVYLMLSGASYPAQRSFLMTAMVMLAIVLDRPAISMRLVTLAATVVLLTSPEALFSPSFQLSFAAVIALIACYELLGQRIQRMRGEEVGLFGKIAFYVLGCALSTLAADIATTPYSIATFHRFTLQGLVTNFLCIPLTTFVLMPLSVATCFLSLVQDVPSTLPWLGQGLSLLHDIATEISRWPGAVIQVSLMPPEAITLFTLGGLWLCFWTTSLRWLASLPLGVAAVLAYQATPPTFLLDSQRHLMAFWDAPSKTLWTSTLPRRSFVLERWKEQLGGQVQHVRLFPAKDDGRFQTCGPGVCRLTYPCGTKRWQVVLASTTPCPTDCEQADLVISSAPRHSKKRDGGPLTIDGNDLRDKGACLVWLQNKGLRVKYAREAGSNRPWHISHQSFRKKHVERGHLPTLVK